ncbi:MULTISPECIES: hypothetical protein [Haloferax]|uniref:Uncharacterized protein n=1 Tax=Haloferax marinum TaxID=2666143 RepID=A0A6A8GAX1_9EURY|nr:MULTISPECIES: hypothetical protein [Haloferax]KAB1198138.1 hypothetical protein Hfx1150_11655 [Haloferax sp. CBA1150]MRW97216.1 hypothetical protein [Haloferax marinum]
MPEIEGEIPQDVQDSLTSLAEELYWGGLNYYDARDVISERAEDLGMEVIGISDNRIVIKLGEDRLPGYEEPLVAKLPQRKSYGKDGMKQNIEEIDLYQNGPDWLGDYLAPIEVAHPRGFWLVMRFAPVPDGSSIEKKKRALLDHGILTNEILAIENWGEWHGDVYLTDYGLGVAAFLDDIEIREWVDIVDEEDRRRGIISD